MGRVITGSTRRLKTHLKVPSSFSATLQNPLKLTPNLTKSFRKVLQNTKNKTPLFLAFDSYFKASNLSFNLKKNPRLSTFKPPFGLGNSLHLIWSLISMWNYIITLNLLIIPLMAQDKLCSSPFRRFWVLQQSP